MEWTNYKPPIDGIFEWRVDEFDEEPDRIEIRNGETFNVKTGSRRFITGGQWRIVNDQ